MRVRITAYITAPEYAYYPGQIIVDHPDESRWLLAGQAEALDVPKPPEPAKNEQAHPRHRRGK